MKPLRFFSTCVLMALVLVCSFKGHNPGGELKHAHRIKLKAAGPVPEREIKEYKRDVTDLMKGVELRVGWIREQLSGQENEGKPVYKKEIAVLEKMIDRVKKRTGIYTDTANREWEKFKSYQNKSIRRLDLETRLLTMKVVKR